MKKIFGIAVLLLILIVAINFNQWPTDNPDKPEATDKPEAVGGFYKVALNLNPGTPLPVVYDFDKANERSHLGNYLIDVLGLKHPIASNSFEDFISLIAYQVDSQQPSPYGGGNRNRFNQEYFLLLKPSAGVIDTIKTYQMFGLTATVSEADPKLLPFINDATYCEVDSDCSLEGNFCNYGAYNNFRAYFGWGWGCEGTNYPQEGQEKLWAGCDANLKHPEVTYSGVKCIANKCVAQNPVITCEDGALP